MRAIEACGSFVRRLAFVGAAVASVLIPKGALGACVLNVAERVPWIRKVSLDRPQPVPSGRLRVTFLGHSSFLVETPGGASIVTDYNDQSRPAGRPDAATMSNPHNLHSSDTLDAAVTRSLRGWDPNGGIAKVDVTIKDAKVFNVPTNFTESGGVRTNGNSIFVVQAAGLCVAHLGNLRHLLDKKTLRTLGRIDVLFISADGSWTLNHPDALRLIRQIGPAIVIPMQYDLMGPGAFATAARQLFPVKVLDRASLLVGRRTLPRRTEIWFLRDSRLGEPGRPGFE